MWLATKTIESQQKMVKNKWGMLRTKVKKISLKLNISLTHFKQDDILCLYQIYSNLMFSREINIITKPFDTGIP